MLYTRSRKVIIFIRVFTTSHFDVDKKKTIHELLVTMNSMYRPFKYRLNITENQQIFYYIHQISVEQAKEFLQ